MRPYQPGRAVRPVHIVKQARSRGEGRDALGERREREEDDRSSEFRQTNGEERERGQCQSLTLELGEEEEGEHGRDEGGGTRCRCRRRKKGWMASRARNERENEPTVDFSSLPASTSYEKVITVND